MKLLLLFLKAIFRGYKSALEALLFDEILWHGEFVIVEACLVFGGRHIILYLFFCRSLMRAGVPVVLRWILPEWVVFGTIWGVIISRAGIIVFVLAGF